MYLTYDEYQEYGGTLDETAFEMYEFEAASKIDYYTFNRLKKGDGYSGQSDEVKEAVTRCEYRLIVLMQARDSVMATSGESAGGDTVSVAGVASQSNDGVSISYNVLSASEAGKKVDSEIDGVIRQYLGSCRNSLGQRLLYRGIYEDE